MKNTSLIVSAVLWLCSCLSMMAAGNKVYVVQSPDKQVKVEISAGTDGLIYSVYHKDSLPLKSETITILSQNRPSCTQERRFYTIFSSYWTIFA